MTSSTPRTIVSGGSFEANSDSVRDIDDRRPSWVIQVFLISLALPVFVHVGSLRLSPYRIVLIALFIPLVVSWVTGALGKARLPDFLVLTAAAWAALSLLVIHGLDSGLESSGIVFIETFGSYLLARRYVFGKEAFASLAWGLTAVVVILVPFAIYENVTGRPILLQFFSVFLPTFGNVAMEARLGFDRAQGTFEHPILFGVFCSSALGLSYYANLDRPIRRRILTLLVVAAVASSLSVGAFVSAATQAVLTLWDKATLGIKSRWTVFILLFALVYVVVDLLSNRTPVEVFISYLTFNTGNSYNRVHIWHYGTQEVYRHPIFGIGFNEWVRAPWMSTSMDNLWLLMAVRHGVLAFLALAGALIAVSGLLGRVHTPDRTILNYRQGLLITLWGLAVAACTVHFWNATYCLFMFLLGSGLWMLNQPDHSPDATNSGEASSKGGRAPLPFSRSNGTGH